MPPCGMYRWDGGLSIDGAGGAIPLPAEMAYRNGLGFERSFSFPVVDWKDACDPASSGSSSTGQRHLHRRKLELEFQA